jgi:pantoate kinase
MGLPALAAAGLASPFTGIGFGLGYGFSLPIGYAYGSSASAKIAAAAYAKKYMYEQLYKTVVDYYIAQTRYSIGLKYHGLNIYEY